MNSRHLGTITNFIVGRKKRLHGQFVEEIPETTLVEEAWSWLRKAHLNIQTEALICAGQEKGESEHHIVCECKKFAQK